jgi:competence protein ComEC
MLIFSLSFLIGDLFLQSYLTIPTRAMLLCAAIVGIGIIIARTRQRSLAIIFAGFFLGFALTGWRATQILSWTVPHEIEGKTITVRGVVDSLPVVDKFGTHFIFTLQEGASVRLSWAQAKKIWVGDRYELNVRLKRVHGMRNPGGFDYEAWAFENKLRATGSVVAHTPIRYLGHDRWHAPVNQIRQKLQMQILKYLPDSETAPWLMALMIGERSSAPPQHWQILRATGTNHLMAIAGLHIGLISTLIYFVAQFLWRCSARLTAWYPAPLAASVAALMIAWVYSGLAGFSIPTQRACIMVTFFIFALLARRQLPSWHAWSAALLVVMLLNPLAVLSDSFWLSFGTLALIAYGMQGRLAPTGWWWKWGRVQWVIGFGLIPLSLLFFQEASIVSVAANSIAIPWLGFLVLPFCLLSSLCLLIWPSMGGVLLWIADKSLAGLWYMLEWFAHLDFAVWTQAMPSSTIMMLSIFACLFLLLPAGVPGRWLGVLWLMPLILHQPPRPQPHHFWVTVLDVGQGLSVVVQTQHHALVYDTGPKFGTQFDMGESVVLPFLRASGVKRIDSLVVSHGDNDHIGGSGALLKNLPVTTVLTSTVDKFEKDRAILCLAGMQWDWDGVHFAMLYPYQESLALGNDSSCVLRIDNGKHSVLLTGDIEKFAEKQLLASNNLNLHADLVTAPHHGSKTSSHAAFIQAVMPQYVVYATGYRNRYHFPHPPVVQGYEDAQVIAFNTVDTGAIQFKFDHRVAAINSSAYRQIHTHYWHDDSR